MPNSKTQDQGRGKRLIVLGAGGTAVKASVLQAAMVREHNWTPGGNHMPLRLAMAPSTIKPTTRSRLDRSHGNAHMTSVVKRGRDLLAPSPISEENEGIEGNVAGPRRLSYSSKTSSTSYAADPTLHKDRLMCCRWQ